MTAMVRGIIWKRFQINMSYMYVGKILCRGKIGSFSFISRRSLTNISRKRLPIGPKDSSRWALSFALYYDLIRSIF